MTTDAEPTTADADIVEIAELLPKDFRAAYDALLRPDDDPESRRLAQAFTGMLLAIPPMLGIDNPGLTKLLESILPMVELQMRVTPPAVIREGICATVGAMLYQTAKAGIPLSELAQWMREHKGPDE